MCADAVCLLTMEAKCSLTTLPMEFASISPQSSGKYAGKQKR